MSFENRTTAWMQKTEPRTRARMPAGRITQEQLSRSNLSRNLPNVKSRRKDGS